MRSVLVPIAALHALSCAAAPTATRSYRGGPAPLSLEADAAMIRVPAGSYVAGSTAEEREQAYRDYEESAGHGAARANGWFEREEERHRAELPGYRIDETLVTQAAYAEFVTDTGETAPTMDAATWQRQGFSQDYDHEVARFRWVGERPPEGRADHPVVLVTWDQARRYCRWRGELAGEERRLPSAAELEKAFRGPDGAAYPWGESYDPDKLNSANTPPRDTTPVRTYPQGRSALGLFDAAGNVFQWTVTVSPEKGDERVVRGSAWDDWAGVGRAASYHDRPEDVRHVIVGFRCAGPA